MREKTINIYDIAKLSGVSIATVSRVINGSPKVSEKDKTKSHGSYGTGKLHTKYVCKRSWT